MKYFIIILCVLSITACSSKQMLTISGIAENAKLGAIVEAEDGIYYIDKLDSWDKSIYGKRVTVSGKLREVDWGGIPTNHLYLKREPDTIITPDGTVVKEQIIRSGLSGIQRIIEKAKWKVE